MNGRKMATIMILIGTVSALTSLVRGQLLDISREGLPSGIATSTKPVTSRSRNLIQRQNLSLQEEPTAIEEGVMTEKQRKHSRLFKRYASLTNGKKLKDTTSETGEVNIAVGIGDRPLNSGFDLNAFVHDSGCRADAVLLGTVNNKTSQLIEDGTFIFTEYDMTVDEVLKNNSASPINPGSKITVARAGGTVRLNGRTIRALDRSERPLEINGRFLLFLQYIPDTGAYKSYQNEIGDVAFKIHASQLFQVSDELLPFGRDRAVDATSFLTQVRSAINDACKN
jgi:hypothetical protein